MIHSIPPYTTSERFNSLDALRGIAALSVVLSHWPHFFYNGTLPPSDLQNRLPLYSLLHVFYTDGHRAVDFFFCLSGFIFSFLYADKIATHGVSAAKFSLLRFSRLYPLHLVTLLFVAAAQAVMRSSQGSYFVYPNNDPFHFILQLTCTVAWWTWPHRNTFNGPFWSVSVEILLYALFFLVCKLNLRRASHLSILVALGVALQFAPCADLGRGIAAFFAGGLTYLAYVKMRAHVSRGRLWGLAVFTGLAWTAAIYNLSHGALYLKYRELFGNRALVMGRDLVGVVLNTVTSHAFALLVFPLTVFLLALLETRGSWIFRRLTFLGEISYSSYLLHFPLQLVVVYCAVNMGFDRSVFSSPWALGFFFAVLISLSALSYRWFELPVQQYLRTRFAGKQEWRSRAGRSALPG